MTNSLMPRACRGSLCHFLASALGRYGVPIDIMHLRLTLSKVLLLEFDGNQKSWSAACTNPILQ